MSTSAGWLPPDAGEGGRLELLKFSYGEVLDATKHQDDKVGRLLGAVAFLTGGALVFADQGVLAVDVVLAGRSYPLAAITLVGFILVDLLAVATYLIAMAAPLTLPRSAGDTESHLYFRIIAAQSAVAWRKLWTPAGLVKLEGELLDEIVNLAKRADRKYGRTSIATNIFLGALVLLAPFVVLGVAAASHDTGLGPMAWDPPLRWSVGVALAVVVFAILLALLMHARQPDTLARWKPLAAFVFSYPALLCMIIVMGDDRGFVTSGALTVVLLGAGAAVALLVAYWPKGAHVGASKRPFGLVLLGFVPFVVVAGLAAASVVFRELGRSDLQLLLALVGGVLVVIPSILDELVGGRRRRRAQQAA